MFPLRPHLGFPQGPLKSSRAPTAPPWHGPSCSKQIPCMSWVTLHSLCVWYENGTSFQAASFAHLLLRACAYIMQVTWRISGGYIKSHEVTQQSLEFSGKYFLKTSAFDLNCIISSLSFKQNRLDIRESSPTWASFGLILSQFSKDNKSSTFDFKWTSKKLIRTHINSYSCYWYCCFLYNMLPRLACICNFHLILKLSQSYLEYVPISHLFVIITLAC